MSGLDIDRVRADFPALAVRVHDKPLCYLDNAASTHKPEAVLDALETFYRTRYSNVHRGVHTLSQQATEDYEAARSTVQRYLGAADPREIVFVRGATEAINLVASTFGERLAPGDEVLVTTMEHHANIVPWQLLAARRGVVLRVAPIDERGQLDMPGFERLLGPRTRLVSVAHASNALGTVNPVERIIALAQERGVPVLLDAAQSVQHSAVDVRALGCDFLAFSGHKVYGPTGIGVLYGRLDRLAELPPYQGGGDMIEHVRFEGTTFAEPPARFEAGTPHIAGAVGLAAALDYLRGLGLDAVAAHEDALLRYGTELLQSIPGLRLVGTAARKVSVLSFVIEGAHPHDLGTLLDLEGVAVRTGHHCAEPLMTRLGIPATTRASIGVYNTREDLERLAEAVRKACRMLL